MRPYTKIGDMYRVALDNGEARYFHFIAKDSSDLNSDVIRIFKHHYGIDERPSIDTILNDEVECHMHTYIRFGIKSGMWEKYGYLMIPESELGDIIFRDSLDEGKFPKQIVASRNWVVWKVNGSRKYVGTLPEQYYSADIGGVYSPNHVLQRLFSGEEPRKYYPSYY